MSEEDSQTMLSFNGQPVALLSDIFEHQGTWFADYTLVPDLPERIMQFVEFSRRRLSVAEFDEDELSSFADVCEGGRWQVENPGGRWTIKDAPLFSEMDVSWIYPEER